MIQFAIAVILQIMSFFFLAVAVAYVGNPDNKFDRLASREETKEVLIHLGLWLGLWVVSWIISLILFWVA